MSIPWHRELWGPRKGQTTPFTFTALTWREVLWTPLVITGVLVMSSLAFYALLTVLMIVLKIVAWAWR